MIARISRTASLLWSLIPILAWAQMDETAVYKQNYPDFGAVQGAWGQVQYYRPFGLKGIVLENFEDAWIVNPLTGEPDNIRRKGWLAHPRESSLWTQTYPDLVSPADTIAPSVLVNYQQGDMLYKDFNLWYHNSLSSTLRFAWQSRLRSELRSYGFSEFDDQQHYLQMQLEDGYEHLRIEVGYNKSSNPLYMFSLDSLGTSWFADDSLRYGTERWEGQLIWTHRAASGSGYAVKAGLRSGDWSRRHSGFREHSNYLVWEQNLSVGRSLPIHAELGVFGHQWGEDQSNRTVAELGVRGWNLGGLTSNLAMRYYYGWHPRIELDYTRGPFSANYATLQIVDHNIQLEEAEVHSLQWVNSSYQSGLYTLGLGAWSSPVNTGQQATLVLRLPWQMKLDLAYSRVSQDDQSWRFANDQVNWEIQQETLLFDQALLAHVKLWGRLLKDVGLTSLNPDTFQPEIGSPLAVTEMLYLLNYTVDAQVSSLRIAFTDMNLLQDPLWTETYGAPWDAHYYLFQNQIPETRFRYLTIIWTFDN